MKTFAILILGAFLGIFSGIVIPQSSVSFAQEEVAIEYVHEAESHVELDAVHVEASLEAPTPADGDPIATISDLIKNWKKMSPVAIGAAIILILVQLLKHNIFGQFFHNIEFKRSLITVLGVLYGVVYLVSVGTDWITALVVGLLSSGGAVAIYEAIKPFLKKKTA